MTPKLFDMPDGYCVYIASHKDRNYIGKTSNFYKRYSKHINDKDGTYFHRALRKYGYQSFTWQIIGTMKTEQDALNLEIVLIHLFKLVGKSLYNIAAGGKGQRAGYIVSEETRAKLSKSMTGRIVSEETRAKSSNTQKGKPKPLSAEGSKAISESNKSRVVSDGTRAKISIALKRRTPTEKQLAALKNKPTFSKEQEQTIKEQYATGNHTYGGLASNYDVSYSVIWRIINPRIYIKKSA